jgi:tRNA 2-thiouridine synthesizing protein A
MEWDDELDAQGLLCPLPVLKARKRLKAMAQGQVLRVLATDPAAVIDIPHFCIEAGHELAGAGEIGGTQYYIIRKG